MSDDGPVCFITDLPMAWCAHCRAVPERPPKVAPEERGPVFIAQYHGTCAVCSGHITPGEDAAALLNDDGYACAECL